VYRADFELENEVTNVFRMTEHSPVCCLEHEKNPKRTVCRVGLGKLITDLQCSRSRFTVHSIHIPDYNFSFSSRQKDSHGAW